MTKTRCQSTLSWVTKNTQIRATNNGFVFETCLPNRFEPLFWRFRAWYSEIDSFRAGRTIFSYVAPKTGCPDTQNKNSVTPCHFYTKIIIILHEKSGVEQNDHFTKLSLWVNLNLGAFGAQNDHFSRLSFYREGTVQGIPDEMGSHFNIKSYFIEIQLYF